MVPFLAVLLATPPGGGRAILAASATVSFFDWNSIVKVPGSNGSKAKSDPAE